MAITVNHIPDPTTTGAAAFQAGIGNWQRFQQESQQRERMQQTDLMFRDMSQRRAIMANMVSQQRAQQAGALRDQAAFAFRGGQNAQNRQAQFDLQDRGFDNQAERDVRMMHADRDAAANRHQFGMQRLKEAARIDDQQHADGLLGEIDGLKTFANQQLGALDPETQARIRSMMQQDRMIRRDKTLQGPLRQAKALQSLWSQLDPMELQTGPQPKASDGFEVFSPFADPETGKAGQQFLISPDGKATQIQSKDLQDRQYQMEKEKHDLAVSKQRADEANEVYKLAAQIQTDTQKEIPDKEGGKSTFENTLTIEEAFKRAKELMQLEAGGDAPTKEEEKKSESPETPQENWPEIGFMKNGFRYVGGDPAEQQSWARE